MREASLEREAALLEFLLRLEVVDRSEVVRWATSKISVSSNPSPFLIELSTMHENHPLDLSSILKNLSGKIELFDVFPEAMSRAHKFLVKNPKHLKVLVLRMNEIVVENQYDIPEVYGEMLTFEDGLRFAENGIFGTLENFRENFLEFLRTVAMQANDIK